TSDLRAPPSLAALLERVRGERALRWQCPWVSWVVPIGRQLGVHVEHDDRACALAMRVRDAVHSSVAATDHDYALALRLDLLAWLGCARRSPLLGSDPAVALVEVVHRVVNARQLATG